MHGLVEASRGREGVRLASSGPFCSSCSFSRSSSLVPSQLCFAPSISFGRWPEALAATDRRRSFSHLLVVEQVAVEPIPTELGPVHRRLLLLLWSPNPRTTPKRWPSRREEVARRHVFWDLFSDIDVFFPFLPFLLEDRPDSRLAAPGSVPPRPPLRRLPRRRRRDQEVDPRQTVLFQEEEERWPGQGGRWWRARSDLAHRVKVVGLAPSSISTSSDRRISPAPGWTCWSGLPRPPGRTDKLCPLRNEDVRRSETFAQTPPEHSPASQSVVRDRGQTLGGAHPSATSQHAVARSSPPALAEFFFTDARYSRPFCGRYYYY